MQPKEPALTEPSIPRRSTTTAAADRPIGRPRVEQVGSDFSKPAPTGWTTLSQRAPIQEPTGSRARCTVSSALRYDHSAIDKSRDVLLPHVVGRDCGELHTLGLGALDDRHSEPDPLVDPPVALDPPRSR